jgi:hypothetical protein
LRELPKWKNKMHQEIADHIHVSRRRVSQVLQESEGKISQTSVNQPEKRDEATNEVLPVHSTFTNDDKRRVVIEQMTKDNSLSDRQIAKLCGVSNKFVSTIRKELFPKTVSKITRKTAPKSEPKAQPPSNSVTPVPEVIDGQEIPETATTPETVQPTPAMEPQQADPPPVQEPPQVQSVPQETTQAPTPAQLSQKETPRNVDGIPVNVPYISSKSNEWYTPAIYIEAVRKVLGKIDIDPASCEEANQIVKAIQYYDLASNGLEKPWKGRVFLNPPYGKDEAGSNQSIWTQRLIDQYADGDGSITEAILLVNASVDTKWFQRLFAYPICFPEGRINFYSTEDSASGSTHGSAFVYFGPKYKQSEFARIFRQFGEVVGRYHE